MGVAAASGADDQGELEAGDFGSWVLATRAAINGERDAEVPCGGCTACCTASQFVHIAPDEVDTLAHIPSKLLFPAPRRPRGHVVLGYDERGHCPMLIDNECSIYAHRPRTCRTYDCRIFPAADVAADDDKGLIARRARRWRFSFPSPGDRITHEAVRSAATFLEDHEGVLSEAVGPNNATRRAVIALEVHDVFLGRDRQTGKTILVTPDTDMVRVELARRSQRHD